MKKWGLALALALVIIAIGAWFDWTYHAIQTETAELQSSLPSEEGLDKMPLEQSTEQLKLAAVACGRVTSLQGNPLARLLRGDEIKALAERCELIKARQDSPGGP
jgi:hypothetical protein